MRAAVLHEVGKPLSIEEVEIDSPKEREVLVRVAATTPSRTAFSARRFRSFSGTRRRGSWRRSGRACTTSSPEIASSHR
jgi:NADPH:quinone reductase-like Zn-dependent oxidoreductase